MLFIIDMMPVAKVLKLLQGRCPGCGQEGEIQLVKTAQCLRFFFIPLFKWGAVYTLQHSCGTEMRISEEDAIAILHVGVPIETVAVNVIHNSVRRCPKCGRVLERDFVRCPYCD